MQNTRSRQTSDRMKNLSAVAATWDDFTQNTTFHGIRYIFGNGMLLRKYVKLIIQIIFIVQIYEPPSVKHQSQCHDVVTIVIIRGAS